MFVGYFKKIPPAISVPLFYGYIVIAYSVRFLVTSVYGAAILSVCLYYYVDCCTGITPAGLSELMGWLIHLDAEYKVALLSSAVTIAGFIVAFHTATANWKNQMRAQLKVQAARDIENFFSVVSSNITTASIYVKSLVDNANKIQKGVPANEAYFLVDYAQQKASEYMAARNLLSQASIDVHRLIGRNNNLLSTGFGLLAAANSAAGALDRVNHKMWIHVPSIDLSDPHRIQDFVNQVNVTERQEFLDACEKSYGTINGISGGLQGSLTAQVWGASFPMFFNLIARRKEFKEAIREFHSKLQ